MSVLDNLVEVSFDDDDNFLKIKETLTRIGVASRKDKKLFQSCHILHKKGKYYIVHFKELFLLDDKDSTLSEEDIARRNTIVSLLMEWDLLRVSSLADEEKIAEPRVPLQKIKIISHKEKADWELIPKYNIGVKR